MEEKKGIKVSLLTVILALIILVLIVGMMYIFLENQKLNKQIIEKNEDTAALTNISTNENSSEVADETDTLTSQLNEKDKTIEQLETEITGLKKTNSENQSSNSTSSYEIGTIKNIYDVISDNDSNAVKAQKVAKEVMNAVNNKDWYYLAKMIGANADAFIKYGIYNYKINTDNYETYDGEYVFNESYDWDKNKLSSIKDVSLGRMLIVKFEDGGRIEVNTNCTGR